MKLKDLLKEENIDVLTYCGISGRLKWASEYHKPEEGYKGEKS